MTQYYYLVASLPLLLFDDPAPLASPAWLEMCREQVAEDDYALLSRISFDELMPRPSDPAVWQAYSAWETALRNELAVQRAQRLGLSPDPFLRRNVVFRRAARPGQGSAGRRYAQGGRKRTGPQALVLSRGTRNRHPVRPGPPDRLSPEAAAPGTKRQIPTRARPRVVQQRLRRGSGRRGRVDERRQPRDRQRRKDMTKGKVVGVNGNMVTVEVDGRRVHERGRLRGQRREKAQGGGHPHPRAPGRDAGLRDVPRHRHRRRGRVHGRPPLRAPGPRPAGADLRRPAKPAPGTGRPLRFLPRARRLPQPPRRRKGMGLHPGGPSRRRGQRPPTRWAPSRKASSATASWSRST